MKTRTKNYIFFIISLYTICFGYFFAMTLWHKGDTKRHDKRIDQVYENIEDLGQKFVFEKDSLVFWQGNTIPIDSNVLKDGCSVRLKNGLYLKKNLKKGDTTTVWLYPIKHNYPVTNKYLNNSYNKPFVGAKSHKLSQKEMFIFYVILAVAVFCTGIFSISLIIRRPKNKIIAFAILVPIYILYGLLVYQLCSLCPDISMKLYATKIEYTHILVVLIMLGVGFWIYLLSIKLLKIHKKRKIFIVHKISFCFLLSLICGITMQSFYHKTLSSNIEKKAKDLSVHRNKETEEKFVKRIFELEENENFIKLIEKKRFEDAEKFITKTYFEDIIDTYHIGALVFDDRDSMLIQPGNYFVNILSYTEERIASARRIDSVMCWVEDSEIDDNDTYIYLCKSENANIFIECLKKKNSKNLNYSLILSKDDDVLTEQISYAKYYKGDLVYSVGKKTYPLQIKGEHNGWENDRNHNNYYLVAEDNVYVVSTEYGSPYDSLATISLFFICYIVLLAGEYIIRYLRYSRHFSPSIKNSIVVALTLSFILGIIMAGVFNIRSIRKFNNSNNTDILKEKTSSIKFELEKHFAEANNNETLYNTLLELSNSFLTDINVFDTNGLLIATSQKDIFERGYLLNRINSDAFRSLNSKSSSTILLQEKIGKHDFMASYCTINDQNNKTICYLNIPFISQQKAMDDNINSMINNFLNMFLFWINISILLFLVVSNYITRPLKTLRERLSKVKVDDKNEKIEWNNEDEIGELIETYNTMVDKIEESSLLLKQQERQDAWRELAKQVAHDIKNPLTPMKLSIQHLQRLYNEKPDVFEKKFKEISPSLIAQIDSISNIANEFHSYSKPMTLTKEKTDLDKCIRDAINLFNSAENVVISYDNENKGPMYVNGDATLFVRIFNNLLKNSCQAFYDEEEGHIDIDVLREDKEFIISIKDDGCGIKDENKDKIFNTHFSTKTEGNGIGLTIVKTIIESFNGSITFTSQEGIGTTFFIKLKEFEEISQEK